MIDLEYYFNKALSQAEADFLFKFFKKQRFNHLYGCMKFFEELKEESIDWITHEVSKQKIRKMAPRVASHIKDNEMLSETEIINLCYSKITDPASFFPELEIGASSHFKCPNCGKKEAFIPKKKAGHGIRCSRDSKCGYFRTFYQYYTDTRTGANIGTFAEACGVDIYENEVHVGNTKPVVDLKRKATLITKEIEEKKIEYLTFDSSIEYDEVPSLKVYAEMYYQLNEADKLRLIFETFFRFIKKEKNQHGEARMTPAWRYLVSKRCISADNKHLKTNIGFLHFKEAAPVLRTMVNYFGIEDLKKVHLIKEEDISAMFYFNPDVQSQVLSAISEKFDSEELVKRDVLNPLSHKKPYTLKYKVGAVNAMNIYFDLFGADSVLDDFHLVRDEDNCYYTYLFNFLFNKEDENSGLIFFRSPSLYKNMAEEFRVRATNLSHLDEKSAKRFKEIQLGNSEIVEALPFGLTYEALSSDTEFLIGNEGPIDALTWGNSLKFSNQVQNVYAMGIPGTNRLVVEQLGLLRGKTILIVLDQDAAGREAVNKFKKMLNDAGVQSIIVQWDPYFMGTCKTRPLEYYQAFKKQEVINGKIKWTASISYGDVNEVKIAIKRNEVYLNSIEEFLDQYVNYIH
ncbi:MAG: toprim domain-containing protein [Halarcobacter sp.]